jgi:hypothetical protein
MIALALTWFGTIAGRVALGGGIVALLLGMYGCEVSRQRQIGVEKERVSVEKKGEKIDAKATAARRNAERRAPDSLREYVRD